MPRARNEAAILLIEVRLPLLPAKAKLPGRNNFHCAEKHLLVGDIVSRRFVTLAVVRPSMDVPSRLEDQLPQLELAKRLLDEELAGQ